MKIYWPTWSCPLRVYPNPTSGKAGKHSFLWRILAERKKLEKELADAKRKGGGGRPELAQAGGADEGKIGEAIDKLKATF